MHCRLVQVDVNQILCHVNQAQAHVKQAQLNVLKILVDVKVYYTNISTCYINTFMIHLAVLPLFGCTYSHVTPNIPFLQIFSRFNTKLDKLISYRPLLKL